MNRYIDELTDFIHKSPTPYHVVHQAKCVAEKNGFTFIDFSENWVLKSQSKYFTILNNSTIALFTTPRTLSDCNPFLIIGSHTDSPAIKIKPDPLMIHDEKIIKLNTEVYGGPLLYTWFDRVLSAAGLITYQEGDSIKTELFDMQVPFAVIPSTAIHLNKEVNTKGFSVANQKDLLPLIGTYDKSMKVEHYFSEIIASHTGIKPESILDINMSLYDVQKPELFGEGKKFLNSSRIDNLVLFFNSLRSICASDNSEDAINIMLGFDFEEVGSKSFNGADSVSTSYLLERIYKGLGKDRDEFIRVIGKSYVVSADVAHGVHPNNADKTDPVAKTYMNSGLVIKYNSNQKYVTDSLSVSKVLSLCKKKGIPYQKYVNHSDIGGGSTIGPHIASSLGVLCVEVGIPVLAMHSIRETCGIDDCHYTLQLFESLYADGL